MDCIKKMFSSFVLFIENGSFKRFNYLMVQSVVTVWCVSVKYVVDFFHFSAQNCIVTFLSTTLWVFQTKLWKL